eukprot:TRINITY_DN3049_c0_g1_i1.p1 TRINITY_DN3049_c0_g1~~TRINITY_DN3049_c0_g1_i1.p1  ORF type:complete len:438 (-),score=70.20 TRINITY_DN3049_c0_g1_i1:1277-2590(-)
MPNIFNAADLLPDELWLNIVRFLASDSSAVTAFARVCKRFHSIGSDDYSWRALFSTMWPKSFEKLQINKRQWKNEFQTAALVAKSEKLCLTTHRDEVLGLAFSNNGKYLSSVGRDGRCCIWSITYQRGSVVAELRHMIELSEVLMKVVFSEDDACRYVFVSRYTGGQTASGNLVQISVETGQVLRVLPLVPYDAFTALLPGNCMLVCSELEGRFPSYHVTVNICSTDPADSLIRSSMKISFNQANYLHLLFAAPGGSWFAHLTGSCADMTDQVIVHKLSNSAFVPSSFMKLQLNGCILGAIALDESHVLLNVRMFIEPETTDVPPHLRTLSEEFTAIEYEVKPGENIIPTGRSFCGSKAFTKLDSPFLIHPAHGGHTNRLVASGGEDGRVHIWHRETGELLEVLHGHDSSANEVVFHPVVPNLLASAGDDYTVRLWA